MNCKYDPLRATPASSTATAELRGALGMLAVTDDYPPEQAWNEAIELVRVRMAALHGAALEWTQAPTSSEYGPTMRMATIALSNDETLRLLADESAVHLVGLFLRPEIVQAATNDTPSAHALTVELREALGLFAGAMSCSPQQAWDEAITMVKNNRSALSAQAAPTDELTACNCRWRGDEQVQQCKLHEAHVDAIHEWAERAKTAEAALAACAPPPGWSLVPFKPTREMWAAWDKSPFNEDGDVERNDAWAAMLAAAPTPTGAGDALTQCAADRDGDCRHGQCPQLCDGEPRKSGRHCPLDEDSEGGA